MFRFRVVVWTPQSLHFIENFVKFIFLFDVFYSPASKDRILEKERL